MSNRQQAGSLAGHTIKSVDFYRSRARYPRLHGKNAIKGYHGFGGNVDIALINTSEGARGWGVLCDGLEKAKAAGKLLTGKKLGDVFAPETGILDPALHSLDIALHDLAGKILDIPVSRMVDPKAACQVKVYDGAIYMNDIIPEDRPFGPEKVVREAIDDYQSGHRALKIKIGRGNMWMDHDAGMERDIRIVRDIHASLPDALLMVDANDGYTVEDCITFLEAIGDCEIYWFEEPFRECEGDNRRLREYLKAKRPTTYIADGESFTDIALLRDLAGKGLLDVWQPDICGYGFTAWRALLKEIVPKGWLSSPHAWGQVVKTHYCAHLAAAYPHHIPYIEAVLGETEGIDYSGYALNNGILSVPQAAGFGMDFIWGEKLEP